MVEDKQDGTLKSEPAAIEATWNICRITKEKACSSLTANTIPPIESAPELRCHAGKNIYLKAGKTLSHY